MLQLADIVESGLAQLSGEQRTALLLSSILDATANDARSCAIEMHTIAKVLALRFTQEERAAVGRQFIRDGVQLQSLLAVPPLH